MHVPTLDIVRRLHKLTTECHYKYYVKCPALDMVITCIHYACPYLRYCKKITTECHYMYICSVPTLDIVSRLHKLTTEWIITCTMLNVLP